MEYIKKNFFPILAVVFGAILLYNGCNNTNIPQMYKKDTIFHIDTVTNITIVKPVISEKIPFEIEGKTDTIYMPSKNYDELVIQFQQLKAELLSKNIYRDTLKLDTLGQIAVIDSISQNKIQSRKYDYSLKIPTKTITVTNNIPHGNLWFVGGTLSGNVGNPIKYVGTNILLITPQNKGYKIGLGTTNGKPLLEIGAYFKL